MLIRYGCELALVVNNPTSAFCLVDVHPERRPDLQQEAPLSTAPLLALASGEDAFGNIRKRCVLPAGETTFRLEGVIRDSGPIRERLALGQCRSLTCPMASSPISTAAGIARPTNSAAS